MAHAPFQWQDPFLLDQQLSDDERMVREAAAAYCQDKLAPRVLDAFRHEKMDISIFREMGEVGLLGPTIPEQYGGLFCLLPKCWCSIFLIAAGFFNHRLNLQS